MTATRPSIADKRQTFRLADARPELNAVLADDLKQRDCT